MEEWTIAVDVVKEREGMGDWGRLADKDAVFLYEMGKPGSRSQVAL